MKELSNKVAAVTGAASGIGRALAVGLAKAGCHVAISDVNENGLQATAGMIENGMVSIHRVDVARREEVYRYAAEVVEQHGQVDMIINNAGVALCETLEDVQYPDFEWLMGINLWGVIYGCKAFLPYLKQRPAAHIVNISSVNGLFTNPGSGPYCTSKYAVRGFTETLIQELKGTNIKVSCVHPGGVKTDIARNARFYKTVNPDLKHEDVVRLFDRLASLRADQAATIIINGIRRNKVRILVGHDAYIFDFLKRLFPVGFQKLMGMDLSFLFRWHAKKRCAKTE